MQITTIKFYCGQQQQTVLNQQQQPWSDHKQQQQLPTIKYNLISKTTKFWVQIRQQQVTNNNNKFMFCAMRYNNNKKAQQMFKCHKSLIFSVSNNERTLDILQPRWLELTRNLLLLWSVVVVNNIRDQNLHNPPNFTTHRNFWD